jgi:hypothetical protein
MSFYMENKGEILPKSKEISPFKQKLFLNLLSKAKNRTGIDKVHIKGFLKGRPKASRQKPLFLKFLKSSDLFMGGVSTMKDLPSDKVGVYFQFAFQVYKMVYTTNVSDSYRQSDDPDSKIPEIAC